MGTGIDLWHQFEALYSKGDMAGTAELMTDDVVQIEPTGRHEGRETIRAYLKEWDNVLSDMTMETSVLIEDGDVVVAEWNLRCTVTGPLPSPDGTEIAATGRTLEYGGVCVATVRDGKFAALRDYYDSMDMMRQLGLMPSS